MNLAICRPFRVRPRFAVAILGIVALLGIVYLKVATHETGHMFSLAHCTRYKCNMCGSNHLAEADRMPLEMCPHCLAKLCYATGANPAKRFQELIEFYKANGLKAEQEFCEKSLKAWNSR